MTKEMDIKRARELSEMKHAADYVASYNFEASNLNRYTMAKEITVLLRDKKFSGKVVDIAKKLSVELSKQIDEL